tara:strand:- start:6384 stop:6761 length:378 start_codon:yes stop_codon:yes gene_type:complete
MSIEDKEKINKTVGDIMAEQSQDIFELRKDIKSLKEENEKLKKENEKLEIDMINHTKKEVKVDMGDKIIEKLKEENEKLKEENEELKEENAELKEEYKEVELEKDMYGDAYAQIKNLVDAFDLDY